MEVLKEIEAKDVFELVGRLMSLLNVISLDMGDRYEISNKELYYYIRECKEINILVKKIFLEN